MLHKIFYPLQNAEDHKILKGMTWHQPRRFGGKFFDQTPRTVHYQFCTKFEEHSVTLLKASKIPKLWNRFKRLSRPLMGRCESFKPKGDPSAGRQIRGVDKNLRYSPFISETVRDRPMVTMIPLLQLNVFQMHIKYGKPQNPTKKLSWCWQTRATRLGVSQGHQTLYHSIC